MQLAGIVLCGGKSSRMGQPKAWLPFGPEVMLQRVVRILQQVVSPVVVVAAPGQELPRLPADVGIVRDAKEYEGPLRGLAGGLAAIQGHAEAAYLSACDVPFLRPEFISRMDELRGNHDVCVPYVSGFHHPLAAVYQTNVVLTVEALLSEQRFRPTFLFEKVRTRLVLPEELTEVDPTLVSLRNVNTPEEYGMALEEANLTE